MGSAFTSSFPVNLVKSLMAAISCQLIAVLGQSKRGGTRDVRAPRRLICRLILGLGRLTDGAKPVIAKLSPCLAPFLFVVGILAVSAEIPRH